MLARRAMTGLTRVVLKPPLLIGFDFVMRVLLECLVNVLVADLTFVRARVSARLILIGRGGSTRRLLSAPEGETNRNGCRYQYRAAAAGWRQSDQRRLLFPCMDLVHIELRAS